MSRTVLIVITFGLVVALGIIFSGGGDSQPAKNNVGVKNGVQYITINAKGGYSPKMSTGKSGIPTKLIVKTNGTYDCSASLVIHSLGFQKILAQTGEEIIDIGIPKADQLFQGLCGMGMYNFIIKFI